MKVLEIKKVRRYFGGIKAVENFSLDVEEGAIVGLIGPNGAGKSTLFNCVAGVFPPTSGEIDFLGARTAGLRPWDLCRRGLARTFQIVKPFASRSVLYNVMVGAFAGTTRRSEAERRALEVLEHLRMENLKDALAGNLTIADRKRLEIARALATRPKLLLLDEVMAGLRPTEVDEMVGIIKGLRDSGITIFVIEHIMRAIMALSDRIAVLHFGSKIAEGTPREIARDERVIKAQVLHPGLPLAHPPVGCRRREGHEVRPVHGPHRRRTRTGLRGRLPHGRLAVRRAGRAVPQKQGSLWAEPARKERHAVWSLTAGRWRRRRPFLWEECIPRS